MLQTRSCVVEHVVSDTETGLSAEGVAQLQALSAKLKGFSDANNRASMRMGLDENNTDSGAGAVAWAFRRSAQLVDELLAAHPSEPKQPQGQECPCRQLWQSTVAGEVPPCQCSEPKQPQGQGCPCLMKALALFKDEPLNNLGVDTVLTRLRAVAAACGSEPSHEARVAEVKRVLEWAYFDQGRDAKFPSLDACAEAYVTAMEAEGK